MSGRPSRQSAATKDFLVTHIGLRVRAFFTLGFSGILLEHFNDPAIVAKYRNYVDIREIIEQYRAAENIEIIGMGFYHPIFPLIPKEVWSEQLQRGKEIVERLSF